MHKLRLTLATLSLVACPVALPGALAAQDTSAAAFRPFEFLVGSCWEGTFPGGRATDEHCFEPLYGRRFIRDRHVVRGGREPYSGETTYAWDARSRRIVYWYVASDGAYSTGHAEPEGDAIVFPETHVSESGTRELKNVWRQTGEDTYRIEVFEKTAAGSRLLWSMEMKRTRRTGG
ncbi:MAG TPA: hypothetical protein VHG28_10040 [Longimicrobiaceae bacterium]|nr:hypothetical protein [Longimicrobiaceae bacterium]